MKTLETERLILKMFTVDDAEDVYAYASNPNVGPPAGWAPHRSVEESREIIETVFMPPEAWAIRIKGRRPGSRCDRFGTGSYQTGCKQQGAGGIILPKSTGEKAI